ncbi:tetratricopeptide repeat protein [bacterium AH-315-P15]|nr:tetratricopeptide repeat protein [bacterium AH-315-P15]
MKDKYLALVLQHARLLDEMGRMPEAVSYYRQAVELSGRDPHYLRHLAFALTRDRQADEAIEILESLMDIFPDDRELHSWLGTLYQATDQVEKARQVIHSFFSHYPSHPTKPHRRDAPKILRTLGAENTVYKLSLRSNGQVKRKRQGGHFTLKYLLDRKRYNFDNYYILGDNIDRIAPAQTYDLLLNTIADPDVELSALKSLESYIAAHPKVQVINHPSKVISTSRDGNYQTFKDREGIYFPRTERLYSGGRGAVEIAADIEARNFRYPMILRQPGTQSARSTALVDDREALVAYITQNQSDCYYVIEFVKNASKKGHYSKIRFFAIDGVLYPVVYHIDQVWNVHGGNRKTFMSSHGWMLKKERQFLDNPASIIGKDNYKRLKEIPKLIGLDFFGFDFTLKSDGTVLFFELNPAMRHSFDHANRFEYMRPHMQAITDAFTKMVDDRIALARKARSAMGYAVLSQPARASR